MNLQSLPNEILLQNTLHLTRREREVTLEVLHHLREIERRLLYATLSCPSLFEYVFGHFFATLIEFLNVKVSI